MYVHNGHVCSLPLLSCLVFVLCCSVYSCGSALRAMKDWSQIPSVFNEVCTYLANKADTDYHRLNLPNLNCAVCVSLLSLHMQKSIQGFRNQPKVLCQPC